MYISQFTDKGKLENSVSTQGFEQGGRGALEKLPYLHQ